MGESDAGISDGFDAAISDAPSSDAVASIGDGFGDAISDTDSAANAEMAAFADMQNMAISDTPPETSEFNLLETIAKFTKNALPFALSIATKAVPSLAPISLAYSMYNASQNDSESGVGKSTGSVVGSAIGGLASGNVVGAVVGGLAGSGLAQAAASENAGSPGVGSGASTGDTGMDYGDLIGYGLGAYLSNNTANSYSSQMNNLASLYSQDSAYAQMLRKQLQARDAASGRRSQYGAREVELQAKLADLNSRNATTLAQLQGAKSGTQMQTLANLYKMYGVANKNGAVSNWANELFNPSTLKGYSGVEGDTNFMGPTYSGGADWMPGGTTTWDYAAPSDYSYLMG